AGVVLMGLLIGLVVTAGPASAHPTLLVTDPDTDTAVATAPAAVTLVFNESVTNGSDAVTVTDAVTGQRLGPSPTSTARGGRALITRLPTTVAAGSSRVRWQVTGADGDLVDGGFPFTLGAPPAGPAPVAAAGPDVNWVSAALRWLLFAGFAVTLGGVAARRFVDTARVENPTLTPVRSWIGPGAGVAAVAAIGLSVVLVVDTGSLATLWQSQPGRVNLAEIAAAVAVLAVSARARAWWLGLALLAFVAGAEGLRSHANIAEPGWGAVLTSLHVAAAGVWTGGLLHVARVAWAWRGRAPGVRWVFAGYSRLALWSVTVVLATGTLTALLLVPLTTVLATAYGQILLIKLGVVAGALGLAATARLALRGDRLHRLRHLARIEAGALATVLAASAILVSAPPTGSATATTVPAPAPTGPVVALGDLAGQIGVGMAASQGQLVVRLSVPRLGDPDAPTEAQAWELAAQLTPPGAPAAVLGFRPCGRTCFVAPADWHPGPNLLTVRVGADGWRGATVAAVVAWPAQPAADQLSRTVAAMRAAGRFTVYESVTSDTTAPAREPTAVPLSSEFFLPNEPYADGTAPDAALLSTGAGPVRLALGYPAAGVYARLTLDDGHRITQETLTDPTHLVRRTFVYPDSESG
ncbi:MAG: copper resistance protein CopC, partial [Streptosporangiaceae bacterium]